MEIQQHPHNEYNIIRECKNIQAAISDVTQQVLDLSYLQLTSLPDAILGMLHLKVLDLPFNNLTFFSLNHMKNLVSLNLSFNKLTFFSLSHVKNISSLNLANNQLTFFSLNHAKNLASLDLTHNKLTSFSLNHAKNLASLDLTHNKLTSFSLNHAKNLASLDLTHNKLTSFSLNHVNNLVSLNLAHNQLTSFSFSHMKALDSLNLSYNTLDSFLSCNLPSVTHINLCHNHLSNLDPNRISSLNANQHITLNLRNNPWSIDAMIQIYENLSKRSQKDVIYYPDWFFPITHIKRHAITYENFLHLLSQNNISSSSQNFCLKCLITHMHPRQVIFFVTSNKCYIIYDADALIQWMCTQWRKQNSRLLLSKEEKEGWYTDPYTKEPLTLKNLISANELCVLQYLKQELGTVSTENIDLIHNLKN